MQQSKVLLLLILSVILFTGISFAQDSTNVSWESAVKSAGKNKYEVRLKGTIRPGWHLYSNENEAEGLNGITIIYEDSAIKKNLFNIIANNKTIRDPVFENKEIKVATDSIVITEEISFDGPVAAILKLNLNYYTGYKENFIPEEKTITLVLDEKAALQTANRLLIPSININKPMTECGKSATAAGDTKSKGLLNVFWLGFLGGFIALILPCLFPMIPLTVSFFTKKATSKSSGVRNAFLYGFFIFLIYILISLPFHFLEKLNPAILNNISTNVYLNIAFFAIFIFFAFSFFGYYDITLPSALSSKADSKAGAGNVVGINACRCFFFLYRTNIRITVGGIIVR
jgi:thiol:disulfide interchange protein